jgi:hypothetical protein
VDLLYTTISLCLDLFPWAKFRQAKGGVKAHVLLDHDDYLPSYILITEAKTSDVRVAQSAALRTHHHRRHLQGPLGNRAVFQSAQTKPEGEEFVGTSRNALLIQIWTALIAMLLLKWLHHLSKAKWSFSNLACMLRLNLFTYRDLQRWLANPFGIPPLVPLTEQLSLNLS